MGRQKFNKRDHIQKVNMLHENRYLTNKGLLNEQQSAATCYICSGNTVHQQVFYPPLYPWGNNINQHISGVVAMTPSSNWPTAGTIDAYSCFGGQMVTFAFPSNNIQAVPHIGFGNNDIFVELGYSYWSSGIDQNEYGQPDSDIDPFINYGQNIGFNSGG